MSISEMQNQLKKAFSFVDTKVVTVSGPWGSGKTYLVKQLIKSGSPDIFKSAKFVSLYGVNDIDGIKSALLRNVFDRDTQGADAIKKIKNIFDYLKGIASTLPKTVLATLPKTVSATLNVSNLVLPSYLRDSFVVFDDIERVSENLNVECIAGFVNECTSQYGTKFILIMNKDEMSCENKRKWEAINEKIVDFEINHTILSSEAFDIAAKGHSIKYREEVKETIKALNIKNIRVINKILYLYSKILNEHASLIKSALSQIISHVVLTGAVYYKEVKHWESIDSYLLDVDSRVLSTSTKSEKNNTRDEDLKNGIISSLNLVKVDGLASGIVRVIKSCFVIDAELNSVIERLSKSEAENIAKRNSLKFRQNYYWGFKKDDNAIRNELRELLCDIKFLKPVEISALLDFMGSENVCKEYEKDFLKEWIKHNKGKTFSYYERVRSDGTDMHPDILREVRFTSREVEYYSVKDALANISENKGWGLKERETFSAATETSIKNEIYAMSAEELKRFISNVAYITQPSLVTVDYFLELSLKINKAFKKIISDNKYPKLSFILGQRMNYFPSDLEESVGFGKKIHQEDAT